MRTHVTAVLLGVMVVACSDLAAAEGWSLWPFAKKTSTVEKKPAHDASRLKLPLWSKPAPELKSSRATAPRPSQQGPSTLSKVVGAPRQLWDRTAGALKMPSRSNKPARKVKRDFSVWPASWFATKEEEPQGPRTVKEFLKQPRPGQ